MIRVSRMASGVVRAAATGAALLAVALIANVAGAQEATVRLDRSCGFTAWYDTASVEPEALGVRIDEITYPQDELTNVGDIVDVTVRISIGWGLGAVRDENRRPGAPEWIPGNVSFSIGGQECAAQVQPRAGPVSFDFYIAMFAQRPGPVDVVVHANVTGLTETFPFDEVGVARVDEAFSFSVGEPYTVDLRVSPGLEVDHGTPVQAFYVVTAHTMIPGRLEGAFFDGEDLSGGTLPSARSRTGTEEWTRYKSKRHDGCRFIPPHPGSVGLPFAPNHFEASLVLRDGTRYRQVVQLADLEAIDFGELPECPDDTHYDDEACDCVPDDEEEDEATTASFDLKNVKLLSSTNPLFLPGGIDFRISGVVRGLDDPPGDPDNPTDPPDDPTDPPAGPGPAPFASLAIEKVDLTDPVEAGQELVYRITVTNQGTAASRATSMSDTLPPELSDPSGSPGCDAIAGSVFCDVPALAPGETIEFEIRGTVSESAANQTITNRATVPIDPASPTLFLDEAVETTDVIPAPTTGACASGVIEGLFTGTGACGIGEVTVICQGQDTVLLRDPPIVCGPDGDCGPDNVIFDIPGHLCRMLDPSSDAFRLLCQQLTPLGEPAGPMCTEDFMLRLAPAADAPGSR